MTPESSSNAVLFHRLHQGGLLLLANAWDAGSARLIESLGAKAIATSSAAVARSHGYADGDHLPVRLLAGGGRLHGRESRLPRPLRDRLPLIPFVTTRWV